LHCRAPFSAELHFQLPVDAMQNAVSDRRAVSFYTNATVFQDNPSNPATGASVSTPAPL
jgi:hypothetical protein